MSQNYAQGCLWFCGMSRKTTYGLGSKLILTRNKDEAVIDKAVGTADARIKIDHIHWYVPHYTTNVQQENVLVQQILDEIPTEFGNVERSVFLKEVNDQNLWNFELNSQESMNVPILIIIGVQQRNGQDSQNLNIDSFFRLPVVISECIIGTEKHPDSGILINYDDYFNQGYSQIKEAFRA